MPLYEVVDPSAVYPIDRVRITADDPGQAAIQAASAMVGCPILENVDQQVAFGIIDSLIVTCLDRVDHWQSALRHINEANDAQLNAARHEGMAQQDAEQQAG